jgi:hypothetical protein
MNNKGQVLVIFVILLPIFLILLTFVIDIGMLSIQKRRVDNNTYDALEYYLDTNNKYNAVKLVKNNIDNVTVDIKDNENEVKIIVNKKYKGIFNIIYDNEINIIYKGIKETKKIIKG